jgi:hypothetical protein
MRLCDVHCHFFSTRFLELLTGALPDLPDTDRAIAVSHRLGWDDPGSAEDLADRWAAELDRHRIGRASLIASVPGDEDSVASALQRHPGRFVGFFVLNATAPDAVSRAQRAYSELGLRCMCLFPALHRYRLDDDRVASLFEVAAAHGGAVFAHCGFFSLEARTRLGLRTTPDLRLGDPLALSTTAMRFPGVPVIVPHFGGGFFREALMAAEACPSLHFDTSSSNGWIKYVPGLTLIDVFRQALAVVGPGRLIFGSDSSFFPRGWRRVIHGAQQAILDEIGAEPDTVQQIFSSNFERVFPV